MHIFEIFYKILIFFNISVKPQFPPVEDGDIRVFQVREGQQLLINLTAQANPPEIEYKWTNPSRNNIPEGEDALPESRIISNGGIQNITYAKREHAGKFKLRATNAEGKTVIKFKLEVQYAPR